MGVVERTNLRNLYLYLVCLVTLVMAIFAAVNVVRDGARLVYPDPGYYGVQGPSPAGGTGPPSEPDQRRLQRAARDSQRHQAVLGLVGSAAMLAVAGPVYLYHWRRVQSEGTGPSRAGSGQDGPGS